MYVRRTSFLFLTICAAIALLLFRGHAHGAEFAYSCDVVNGFDFLASRQTTVGYITQLKISDVSFAADLQVADPESPTDNFNVVGVVRNMYWAGGYADPIQFSAQVSTANKNSASLLILQTLSDTKVELQFRIYAYDVDEKKYYKTFHTKDNTLLGLIERNGSDLSIDIDLDQSPEVLSPKNFTFTLGTMPNGQTEHEIHIAVSVSDKLVKQWGSTTGIPDITIEPSDIDFSTVSKGSTPEATVTIYNDGTAGLNIGAIGKNDPLEVPFSIVDDQCSNSTLLAGEHGTIKVRFDDSTDTMFQNHPFMWGGMGLSLFCVILLGGLLRKGKRLLVPSIALFFMVSIIVACTNDVLTNEGDDDEIPTAIEYTGSFDIPSNDPDSPSIIVHVRGSRE